MERGKKTDFILRQFRRKSKQLVNREMYTEFFYLNRDRRVIEFISSKEILRIETFFKEFLPKEFIDFVSIKVLNDVEESVKTWYYEEENLVFVIGVNWGFKKQEISTEISIDPFINTVISGDDKVFREINYALLNDYIISFLTLHARNLAKMYENYLKVQKVRPSQ